jgi:predicted 2-oxoglutarate/Fe(II)-dependent dioxygenase YbiX
MTDLPELERRAATGDADAEFALGARLTNNPPAPEAFVRGMALVQSAADKGQADAACMLATAEAIGAGRPQSWERAFDTLARAAALGSARAGRQLILLTGGDEIGAPGSDRAASRWAELRAQIDLGGLLQVPPRTSVSEQPFLRLLQGFASRPVCRWIMGNFAQHLAPAMVWDSSAPLGKVDPHRSSSAVELSLPLLDVVLAVLRARIAVATRIAEPFFEVPQLMHYAVGQEFRPHHDYLDPQQPGEAADLARRGQRIGTMLVYLNDDYDGGETLFPRAGLSVRARQGDALFFSNVTRDGGPDPLTIHAGSPPTRGEKWVLSQWIRDRLPR